MKKILGALAVIILALAVSPNSDAKKNVIRVPGGAMMEQLGLGIDAGYDSRLDTFIPGYKVVNVAIISQSFKIITFDPEKDTWSVKLEGDKRSYPAIFNLRSQDPKSWSQIPERAQGLVTYPLVLPIGAREVIDIFVPDKLDMQRFNELDIYIKSLDTKFEILVRQ